MPVPPCSHDQAIWNQLNQIVEGTDNAVAGEAAGLSMGLVSAQATLRRLCLRSHGCDTAVPRCSLMPGDGRQHE